MHPGVKGWKPIVKLIKEELTNVDTIDNTKLTHAREFTSGTPALLDWVNGVIFVYSTLFAFGKLLLGFTGTGLIFLFIAIISGVIMYQNLPRKERNNI